MKKQMVEILEKFFLTYFLAASLIFSLDSASSFSTKILRIDFQIDSKRFLRLSFVFFILGLRLFLPRLISFTKKMIDRIQRINLLMFLIGLSGLLSLCLPVFHPFLFILMFIIMLAGWLGVNFVNEAGSEEKPTEKDFSFRLLFRLLCLSLVFYGWFIFVIKKATIAFSLFSERPWFNNFAGGLMSLEITGFLFFLWFASVLVLLGLLIFNRKKISFSRVGTAEKRSRMLILTVIFMAAFLVRLRASSFNSHFPDSFIFPLVAVNMVENGILSFGWKTLPAVNINSYLPSGRLYFRGILFSISQAVVFKLFGPTDFTARLPGILFGSFSVLLLYFIARRAADKKTALLASLLMAFSGWEVYMSTFIRHYVLHTAFFLLIIYLYFSYQEKKIDYRFFLFCLALSLWSLVHVQAFMLFCPLLLLIFINTFIRNDGRRKFFLRALNLVLIFSVPFFLLFNPWPQTRTVRRPRGVPLSAADCMTG